MNAPDIARRLSVDVAFDEADRDDLGPRDLTFETERAQLLVERTADDLAGGSSPLMLQSAVPYLNPEGHECWAPLSSADRATAVAAADYATATIARLFSEVSAQSILAAVLRRHAESLRGVA